MSVQDEEDELPEEAPIVPVIHRPESRHLSEVSLDRERRIAREVREGRERFEWSSQDREQYTKAAPAHSKPTDAAAPSRPETIPERKMSDEGRKVSRPGPRERGRKVSRDEVRRTSRNDSREDEHRRRSRGDGRVGSSRPVLDIVNSSSKPVPPTQYVQVQGLPRQYLITHAII